MMNWRAQFEERLLERDVDCRKRQSCGKWAYARTMPHCAVAGARIHYEVDGEGEPLVLIAGTAFDLSFWDDLLPELRGFRVLRLDNRGAGLSDAPDEAFSIEQMADDVAAVMDAAGMPSAHVYGISMGGLIAQDLAIRYPARVLSLVLGATYAGGPPLSRAVRALPLLLSGKGPEDLLRATAPYLSATAIPATNDRFPGHALAPRDKRGLRRQLSAQLRYSSMRRLHTIRQPTLIMHGEKDRLISPLNARRMTRRVRGARLRLIAGAGHMYRHDRPGESHDLLLDFLMEAAGRLLDQDELELKRGPVEARRIDGTVLITDIVGSTEHAARLGDVAWDRLLAEHDAAVHAEIDHHHGTRIKMTGDGVLALFESAVDASLCALAIRGRVRGLGLEVRAGVHTGSFLISGDDLHGLGLHIAARVMASAIDGGVRVTAETVASLGAVVSSTHPIGPTTLRGIPGEWDLYELDDFAIH
jgi:pimeloyl-ACP methyl ester carboxylesterase